MTALNRDTQPYEHPFTAIFSILLRRFGLCGPTTKRPTDYRPLLSLTVTLFIVVILLAPPPPAFAYNILFTTRDADGSNIPFANAGEQLRIDLLTGWGHTVTLVHDGATQAEFDAAIGGTDVAYVTEETFSNALDDKLSNACIGVVDEDPGVADILGFATPQSISSYTSEQIYINDVTHYITQPFAGSGIGSYTIFTAQQRLNQLDRSNNVSVDADFHAWRPTDSNYGTLVTMEMGSDMVGGGTTAGRRVLLPWGDHQMTGPDFATITADGETIMRRSLEWAAMRSGCFRLTKRAFLADGTPVTSGITLPKGTEIRFLLYINNTDPVGRTDISVQDVLDPGFGYLAPSLKTATRTACSSQLCTAVEEQNIFNIVNGSSPNTDNADAIDETNYDSLTPMINAGNQNAANLQLNIAGSTVWALLFSARLQ